MGRYQYRAKDLTGKEHTDIIEAETVKSAAGRLQSSGYFPVSIEPYVEKKSFDTLFSRIFLKKVKQADVTLFTRRLADSLKGGLPLARAFKVLERQTENKEFARITREIALSIEGGQGFADALEKYPGVFPEMFRGMVRAGESAGLLETVLLRLAEFSEREEELRYRIKSALAYPVVMLGVGFVSVLFLLGFVIPKFELMFQDLGQLIPLPTRILIFSSHALKHGWWIYVPLLVLTAALFRRFNNTSKGQEVFASAILKLPVFGNFIQKDLISRFIRMLSVLLNNGVPILDSLLLARNTLGNRVYAKEIDKIHQSVKEGEGLVKPVSRSRYFPPVVAEMIAVGEETGNLESSLLRVADIYEREVEYAVKTMTSLLEPLIILAAGFVVCFIALSMLLPVFQMSVGIR